MLNRKSTILFAALWLSHASHAEVIGYAAAPCVNESADVWVKQQSQIMNAKVTSDNQAAFTKEGGYGPDVYDALIRTYSGYRQAIEFHMDTVKQFVGKPNVRGIDAGSGTAIMTETAQKILPQAEVSAFEYNPQMIEHAIAKGRVRRERTIQGDAQQIGEIAKGEYDFVISHSMMWALKDARAFVRGVAKIVKPGGLVSVSTGQRINYEDAKSFTRTIAVETIHAFENQEEYKALGWIPPEGIKASQVLAFINAQLSLAPAFKTAVGKQEFIELFESEGLKLVRYDAGYLAPLPNGDLKPLMHYGQFRRD